ncbi:MAG: RDD family protein [Proteobacteria bacterium]|nr:RDD family protein [Pseudomonadota bacterium]
MNSELEHGTAGASLGHDSIDRGPRQVVHSPEQVALDLPIAGPMSRALAYSVDHLITLLLEVGIFLLVLSTTGLASNLEGWLSPVFERLAEEGTVEFDWSGVFLLLVAAWILIDFVVEWTYFVAFELATDGRSPGKALMRLRVVRDGGLPIGVRESMLRNLLRIVDVLPRYYMVGLFSASISNQHKRLGNFAAGTLVVRNDRPLAARPIAPPDPEASAFRFDREQLARVGPAELRLLRQTLRRLDSLGPTEAQRVLERAAGALCARIEFEEPVAGPQAATFLRALLHAAEDA